MNKKVLVASVCIIAVAVIVFIAVKSNKTAIPTQNINQQVKENLQPNKNDSNPSDNKNDNEQQKLADELSKDQEKIADKINEYAKGWEINATKSVDIDKDGQNEWILLRSHTVEKQKKCYLTVLKIEQGSLIDSSIALPDADFIYDNAYKEIEVADVFSNGKNEIFVASDRYYDYPAYAFYKFEKNQLSLIDMVSLGIPKNPQGVGIRYFSDKKAGLIISFRVTDGLWGTDYYKWNGTKFQNTEHVSIKSFSAPTN